jgi:GTPase SAR1 family protein
MFNMESLIGSDAQREQALEFLTFWINSIRLHASEAPFLLVGTRKDTVSSPEQHKRIDEILSCDLQLDRICKLVSNVKEDLLFFPIDNTVGAQGDPTITELRSAIEQAVLDDGKVNIEVR